MFSTEFSFLLEVYESTASGKHIPAIYTPYTPLLYSKTGVCRGIPIFLIFDQKHRL